MELLSAMLSLLLFSVSARGFSESSSRDWRLIDMTEKHRKPRGAAEMQQKTKTETAKHTPGPWHVAGHGNGNQELPILREDGKEIGCIRGEAHLADAALIAAAPTTADQLRQMLQALGACRRWVPDDLLPAVNRILTDGSLAYNAATGETGAIGNGHTAAIARATITEAG